MKNSNIFIFTSDKQEGWGAVLNEAMNSGCAVIADAKIGAVPYLLNHYQSGMVYQDGNLEEFLSYGVTLAKDRNLCRKLGRNAYAIITEQWKLF